MSPTCPRATAVDAGPATYPVATQAPSAIDATVPKSEIGASNRLVAPLPVRIEAISTPGELVAILGGASVIARDATCPCRT